MKPVLDPRRTAGAAVLCATLVAGLLASSSLAASPEEARIRTFQSSLMPPVGMVGEPEQRWTLAQRMEHWKVPGISVAVIRDGKLAWARGFGVLQAGRPEKVDPQTVFSVGSVSKVGTAAITLRLVDAGRLDLDRDVNAYLKRWQVPGNAFTLVRPVTLRGILSHSAGLTVHGFGDFQPGEKLPTIVDTLEGRPPATHEPVRVIFVPGARFQYSGGGTTVEQLAIEDTTGKDFPAAAREWLFDPLGMSRSSYENPLPLEHGNIAKAHGDDGAPRALPRGYEAMPEMGASGLWTTPSDYSKLVIAFIRSYQGEAGSFLKARTARQMMTEVGRSPVGLGPFLDGEGAERRFTHGGANDSYRAWIEGHLATGNGVIIFTNGSNGSDIIPEVRRAVARSEGWSAGLMDHVRLKPQALSEAELQENVGVYQGQEPAGTLAFRNRSDVTAYRITLKDGKLHLARDAGERSQPLIPVDGSHFIVDSGYGLTRVEFVHDYSGVVSGLILQNSAQSASEAVRIR